MNILATAITAIILTAGSIQAANVIGYFSNWGIYGDRPYVPTDIPFKNLTHIQYAFFNPETNGNISSFDESADEQLLYGEKIWYPTETFDSTTSIVYLAHKNNVKILASIGGWTGSENFPSLAANEVSRSNFCSQCKALITKHDFDGVDIDWEFPGYAEHKGTANDAENFVLLLSELRDTLDAIDNGKHNLLTLAIPGGSYHGKNFLVEKFYQYVDFISVMTYDFTGSWESKSWHNSPLYDYGSSDNWSIDKAMKYYTDRGVPPSMLNIGLHFYGKTFADCTGPNQPFSGLGSGDGDPGTMSFFSVNKNLVSGVYTRHWDEQAQNPYGLSSDGEYCSYDDTVSIRIKAEYCINNNFGGAIIWELSADKLDDGTQPLLEAASKVLMKRVYTVNKNLTKKNMPYKIKNCNNAVSVFFDFPPLSNINFTVFDMSGKQAFRSEYKQSLSSTFTLPQTNRLQSGKYILKADSKNLSICESFCIFR